MKFNRNPCLFIGSKNWGSWLVFLILCQVFCEVLRGEENGGVSDGSLRVKGIFNSVLPGTERRDSFKLILHPHFGDLSKHDYIRTDVGATYGLTDKWDVTAMTRYYFGNGLKDVSLFNESDFADYEVETKFRFGHSIIPEWDTAINLSYGSLIGIPAPDVTDGLIHRQVTVSSARRLKDRSDLRVFWGLTTDIVSQTEVIGKMEDNKLRDSNQAISAGFVLEQGDIHYTFESGFATDRIWGSGSNDVFSVRPGIIWTLPRRYTFDSKGRWLIGAAIPVSFGQDGTDIGINVKLRMNFRFNGYHKHGSGNPSSEVQSVGERR